MASSRYTEYPGRSAIPGLGIPGMLIPGTDFLPAIPKNLSVLVYDTSMVRCGEIPLYDSLTYTENWYSSDTWELKVNKYLSNVTTLTPLGYVGIIQPAMLGSLPKIGRIESFAPALDKDGKSTEIWTLSGRSAFGGKLKKRIAIPYFSVATNAGYDVLNHTTYESAARHLITVNAISALNAAGTSDTARNIPGISLETNDLLRGDIASAEVVTALKQLAGGAYTDITSLVNDTTPNDVTLPPISAANDALYIGDTSKFHRLTVNLGTAGVYVGTLVWEYYNGSSWTTITGLTDETGAFKNAAGSYDVYWTAPSDWATVSVNGTTQYWVRCRCSVLTSVTTAPLGTQIWCGLKLKTRTEPLLTLLETWSKASGIHFDLDWSGSGDNFTFSLDEGTDRTGSGTAAPVILSIDYRNVLAYNYMYSLLDAAETLYCGGSGNGDSRLLAEVYDSDTRPSGDSRNEAFVDLSNCTTTASLSSLGSEQLGNYLPVQSLTFDYDPTSSTYVLNRDFWCGDSIVVDFPGIATMTSRILSVKYTWDGNGYSAKITVGTEKPDMTSIVKKIQTSTSAIRRK